MEALGTVEVVGLCAAFEAADVAVKTANVELIGYELAKGGGFVTIKVQGQVGAVNSAVAAAAAAAGKINRVVSVLVIPRPSAGLEPLIRNKMTVGYEAPKPAAKAAPKAETKAAAADEPAKKAPVRKTTAAAKPAAAKKTTATENAAEAPAEAKADNADTTTKEK